jgi:hypothetical protein
LWIVGNKYDKEAVLLFSTKYMKNFVLKKSTYNPPKAERLDGVTSRSLAPPVILLFLLKKDEEGKVMNEDAVLDSYSTSNNPFYTDYSKNCEAKYRTHQCELRMEFYIDLMQSFAVRGENVISIYAESKLIIAAKVCYQKYNLITFEAKIILSRMTSYMKIALFCYLSSRRR